MDSPILLDLTSIGQPRRYQVRTTTAVQVSQMKFENELLYVVDHTVLGKNERGYVLQIDVMNAMQKATDLFSRVMADLNQASRKLILQTDRHGALLSVENQPEVALAWEAMRKPLLAKYESEPAVKPFLEAFEQKLAEPGSMEANLRDKGVYGALLVGAYGHPLQKTPLVNKKKISGFFNEIDLPLQLATTAELSAADALQAQAAVLVSTIATVDREAFAETDFRRMMRSIVDDYTFPVDLQLGYNDQHLLDANTGALLRSQQRLSAEVAGIYHNTVTHEVFQQPVA